MFASIETVNQMTLHYENKRDSGVLCHPCDGEAWKHFDQVQPNFALNHVMYYLVYALMNLTHIFKHLASLILIL